MACQVRHTVPKARSCRIVRLWAPALEACLPSSSVDGRGNEICHAQSQSRAALARCIEAELARCMTVHAANQKRSWAVTMAHEIWPALWKGNCSAYMEVRAESSRYKRGLAQGSHIFAGVHCKTRMSGRLYREVHTATNRRI